MAMAEAHFDPDKLEAWPVIRREDVAGMTLDEFAEEVRTGMEQLGDSFIREADRAGWFDEGE